MLVVVGVILGQIIVFFLLACVHSSCRWVYSLKCDDFLCPSIDKNKNLYLRVQDSDYWQKDYKAFSLSLNFI